jgi:hypothetical protein
MFRWSTDQLRGADGDRAPSAAYDDFQVEEADHLFDDLQLVDRQRVTLHFNTPCLIRLIDIGSLILNVSLIKTL